MLDEQACHRLLHQGAPHKPYAYRSVQPGLFSDIVMLQLPPGYGSAGPGSGVQPNPYFP